MYAWRPNLQALHSQYELLMGFPLSPGEKSSPLPVLWVRGQLSDYITPADEAVMCSFFPQYHLITIPQAGHWVHADQPARLIEAIDDFLGS